MQRSYAINAREVERAALPMCQQYHLVTAKIHPLPQYERPLLAGLGRSRQLSRLPGWKSHRLSRQAAVDP